MSGSQEGYYCMEFVSSINLGLVLNASIEARYVGLTFFSNTIIFHTFLDLKKNFFFGYL